MGDRSWRRGAQEDGERQREGERVAEMVEVQS